MRIDEQEYQRILNRINKLTAIDELAAYRTYLRSIYSGDTKLTRLEKVIDLRMRDLLSAHGREP